MCVDAGIGVQYYAASCTSGACVYGKSDVNCTFLGDGGICVGDRDAGFPPLPDGSIWATSDPCAVPVPAPAPPVVSCDEDAGDAAAVCPPPPSVCGSDYVILYYDKAACVGGQCAWEMLSTSLRRCDLSR